MLNSWATVFTLKVKEPAMKIPGYCRKKTIFQMPSNWILLFQMPMLIWQWQAQPNWFSSSQKIPKKHWMKCLLMDARPKVWTRKMLLHSGAFQFPVFFVVIMPMPVSMPNVPFSSIPVSHLVTWHLDWGRFIPATIKKLKQLLWRLWNSVRLIRIWSISSDSENRGQFLWLTGGWVSDFYDFLMDLFEHLGFGAFPLWDSVWCSPAGRCLFRENTIVRKTHDFLCFCSMLSD